jgi:hypothetical protein
MIHVLLYVFFIAGYICGYYAVKLLPTHWPGILLLTAKVLVYGVCIVTAFALWYALAYFLSKKERSRL